MTQESQTARKITAYLDAASAELTAGTVYRLQQARARALERLETAAVGELAYAGRGTRTTRRSPGWHAAGVRWIGALLLLAAAWFGWQQYQSFRQVQELQEIDSQILSSDLPIDAYLDRGFQNWLKASFDR